MDIQISPEKKLSSASFLGYKGSSGTAWNIGTNSHDWSGCYIGMNVKQSKGYIELDKGEATLWKCDLVKAPLVFVHVTGKDIYNINISGEDKAKEIKRLLNIRQDQRLIPTLGEQNKAYVGKESEKNNEVVIPWSMVENHIIKWEIFRRYKYKGYEPVEWSPDGNSWHPMDTEPKDDKESPISKW